MEDRNYTYETKCRRCGSINKWWFSERKRFDYSDFLIAMDSKIQSPRVYHCKICKKETVQDVVSYSSRIEE